MLKKGAEILYLEDRSKGNQFRQDYLKGIYRLIEQMTKNAEKNREAIAEKILRNQELYREKFCEMLGFPLNLDSDAAIPEAKRIFVAKDGDVSIYRMQFDILNIPFYGILFLKEDGRARPFVIAQHGGLGTPEFCSDMLSGGSENYNGMVQRILKYDVNVFAPQLLLWSREFLEDVRENKECFGTNSYTDSMRRGIDNSLKQLGSSVAALEIFGLKKIIDYFASQNYVMQESIGFAGLSYGGFYALFVAACDKRIKCSMSCSFFNNRVKYNWSDWTWFDSGNVFCDAEIALLIYPRKLFIGIGDKDELFDVDSGIKEYEKLTTYTKEHDWVYFEHFDGMHEFFKNNNVIDSFVQALRDEG